MKKEVFLKNGVIPWKIKEDSDYFRDVITYKTNNIPNIIIMGRRTYEQMGLVKGHINIIISTTIKQINTTEKYYIVDTVDNILKLLKDIYNTCEKVFVCGGGFIYDEFIHYHNINKIKLKIY
jgi:dihydrofolate reductase